MLGYNNVKNVFSGIGDFFSGLWEDIKSRFTSFGDGIGESVGGAFKAVINTSLAQIENIINKAIDFINGVIDTINDLPIINANIGTLSPVNLPQLANGGITTGSTLAEIGEAGREAVLPLERDTAWADIIADRLAARMPDYSAPTQIVMELDGKVFARGELPYFQAESRRIGVTLRPT